MRRRNKLPSIPTKTCVGVSELALYYWHKTHKFKLLEESLEANLPAYFSTWSDEILSRADRVRNLIGSRHWLSDGSHKEFLLQEFLGRHLPRHLIIGRGFVRALTSDNISPEIDVLITDPLRHVPLFNEGGLVIAAPSSIIATFQVKSTYRKAVLSDAMDNVAKTRTTVLNKNQNELWSGILFATIEDYQGPNQIIDDLIDIIKKAEIWNDKMLVLSKKRLVPQVVFILNQCVLLLDHDSSIESIRIRSFDSQKASTALGLAQLFSFVRATYSDDGLPAELDQMLERIDGLEFIEKSVAL